MQISEKGLDLIRKYEGLRLVTYVCPGGKRTIGSLTSSTLLKKLNAEDLDGAANEFLKWNKAKGNVLDGLTERRKSERELFLA